MADKHLVPNTQSTARDHLANERTFLAWVRTALGVVGLGLVFEKLIVDRPGVVERTLSMAMVVAGVLLLFYAIRRYQRVCDALLEGQFPITRRSPIAIGVMTVAVAVAVSLWIMAQ